VQDAPRRTPRQRSPTPSVAAASGKLISAGMDYTALAPRIKTWGLELGFQAVGIAMPTVGGGAAACWNGWAGLAWRNGVYPHGALRARPAELKPGRMRVNFLRMDYAAALENEEVFR